MYIDYSLSSTTPKTVSCQALDYINIVYILRAIAHAADPLWESKVGVAFGMVNLDTHGPTKNQNDRFNFL